MAFEYLMQLGAGGEGMFEDYDDGGEDPYGEEGEDDGGEGGSSADLFAALA